MPFADKLLTCEKCGRPFVFTVTEQRRMVEAGQPLVEPTMCPKCRAEAARPKRKLEPGQVYEGRVKWFSPEKGYGFIRCEDGTEIFFHRTGIARPGLVLEANQPVTFEVEVTPKGPQAVRVTPVAATPASASAERDPEAGILREGSG
ncbi:cold shock domain-containing protein [Thermoflexus sp.]|jgi:CspA family cold shock protein|uniref:cold shock domain-containing protein n=1 Tax=Thermoflexus sp. TaxID=1969742 RepID=UPI003BFF99D7